MTQSTYRPGYRPDLRRLYHNPALRYSSIQSARHSIIYYRNYGSHQYGRYLGVYPAR
ncbi:hypothetical protein BMETH_1849_0 [methanotrophic bacterial endosymbiont of Bathymodiolus sp.]|nr:hypothetical protein BMETH_1849_0 [methanotrophic bacterial endosymbiont of Bathymodiolus sp.]